MDRETAKGRLRALIPELLDHGAPLRECSDLMEAIRRDSPVIYLRLENLLRNLPHDTEMPKKVGREALLLSTALTPS